MSRQTRSPYCSPGAVVALCLAIGLCAAAKRVGGEASLSFTYQAAAEFPHRPGTWDPQRVTISNPTNHPQQVTVLTHSADDPVKQFGRCLVVPPGARRRAQYAVRLPADASQSPRRLELHTDLWGDLASDAAVRSGLGRNATVVPTAEAQATGLLASDAEADEARSFVSLTRVLAGLSPRVQTFDSSWMLPTSAGELASFDQIVVATNRVLNDPQGVIALRQWLHQGGRLWILLDKTGEEVPAALLGDSWRGVVLEATTRVQVQLIHSGGRESGRRNGRPCTLAVPTDFLLTESGTPQVDYTVDGWPAAFSYRAGRGTVLLTTLGASAWQADVPADALDALSNRQQAIKLHRMAATLPLGVVARNFFHVARRAPAADGLSASASELIGYQIPPRRLVGVVLVVLCLSLLGISATLHHTPWRSWAVLLAPPAALLAAVVLAVLGRAGRASIPATFASQEIVEVFPATSEYQAYGSFAVYRAQSEHERVEGQGLLERFDPAGEDAVVRRFVWTDFQRWRLERIRIPSGVTTGRFVASGALSSSAVRASLGPTGIEGRLDLPREIISSHGVVLFPAGPPLEAAIAREGGFRADVDSVLAPGSLGRTSLVDDQQKRREAVLSEALREGAFERAAGPVLACWTRPWDSTLSFAASEQTLGEALVLAPVTFDRPAVGSIVRIPAGMMAIESVAGPDGTAPTSAYSNLDQRWVEGSASQTKIWLRFQIPAELTPLKLTDAALLMEIHAPDRRIGVAGWNGSQRQEFASLASPNRQAASIPISEAALLQTDATGGVLINIDVGPHAREKGGSLARAGWRIRYAHLTATGVVLDPGNAVNFEDNSGGGD